MKLVAEIYKTFIPECKDLKELRGFWGTNKGAITELEKDNALYEGVLANFKAHAEKLEAAEKGEAA